MAKYKIIGDVSVPMFGSFKKEFPEQFSTKRKSNIIYCFSLIDINESGVVIKSLLDKHTDTVSFEDVTKIKHSVTGDVIKYEKYDIVSKEYATKHFMENETPLILFDTNLNEISCDSIMVKKGSVILSTETESYPIESLYIREGEVSFG